MAKSKEPVWTYSQKIYTEKGLVIPADLGTTSVNPIKSYVSRFTCDNHLKKSTFIINGKKYEL